MKNFKSAKRIIISVFTYLFCIMLFSSKTFAEKKLEADNQKQKENQDRVRYKVERGDTLWGTAGKFFHNVFKWPKIWHENKFIKNPNRIYPGNVLSIPDYGYQPATTVEPQLAESHITYQDVNKYKYYPSIHVYGKLGNKRHIGRIGLLFPLMQTSDSVIYTTVISMIDTKDNIEGNFGLGGRYMIDHEYILGAYAFGDIRKSASDNRMLQLTVGAEYLRRYFEVRGNVYIPEDKEYFLRRELDIEIRYQGHRTFYRKDGTRYFESAMYGFDLEVGGAMPQLEDLQGFVSYYHFFKKHVSPVPGVRVRANYNITDWLSIESEISHDRLRDWVYFGGIQLHYDFGARDKGIKLTALEKKMTQLPVRDIDIVHDVFKAQDQQIKVDVAGKALIVDSDLEEAHKKDSKTVISKMTADATGKELLKSTTEGAIKAVGENVAQVSQGGEAVSTIVRITSTSDENKGTHTVEQLSRVHNAAEIKVKVDGADITPQRIDLTKESKEVKDEVVKVQQQIQQLSPAEQVIVRDNSIVSGMVEAEE